MRIAAILAALLLCSGCWVADELDSGSELMDKHSKRGTKEHRAAKAKRGADTGAPAEPTAPAAKPEGPGMLEEIVAWVGKKLEGPPPPPDPGDAPVRCLVGKSQLFSSRSDCEARGGRPIDLPPDPRHPPAAPLARK
jgi:hypothetical protein